MKTTTYQVVKVLLYMEINFNKKGKLFKILLILVVISSMFSFIENIEENSIHKYKIIKCWPIRNKKNKDFFNYTTFNYVITHKDYVLFEFPQEGGFNDSIPNKNTYFQLGIFKGTDKLGYFTDSKKRIINKKIEIDTLLGNHGYPLKPLIVFNNCKLVSEQRISNGKKYNLIRKYITLIKKNTSYADTITVYFSNKGIRLPLRLFEKEFILENKLDVAKFEFIYNPRRYDNDTVIYPKSILSMSIDEIEIKEYDRYLTYFKKLKI